MAAMKYEYLEKFFKTPRGLAGPSEIAKQLGKTRQAVFNWKKHGVPKDVQESVAEIKKLREAAKK